MNISAIILTYNEERHIARCIESVMRVADKIYVVDSFSTDNTCHIASECGAIVTKHEYINQAQQFQWALDNLQIDSDWVMRMDADEYLTDSLVDEIRDVLPTISKDISGIYIPFDVIFLGKRLRFGKLHSPKIMRIWRTGHAFMEQRWMDERMVLTQGKSVSFKHKFIDHNLNSLSWWTQKHNNYSNRELAVTASNLYGLSEEGNNLKGRNQKKGFYYSLPPFLRASIYFTLRYFCLFGFLDGKQGLIWATLQAYWYRFLIDAKLYEMKKVLGKNPTKNDVVNYFKSRYNINLQ